MDERLKRLIAKREAAHKEREQMLAQRKAIVQVAEDEAREDLSDEEDTEFRDLTAKLKDKDGEIARFDERISELSEEAEREATITDGARAVQRARSRAEVLSEPVTYREGGKESYFRDLVVTSLNMDGTDEARQRLQRHAAEVREGSGEFRDLSRTDGSGGYFVPPAWLMSQWVELARAGRPTANAVPSEALPAGTDSINVPKVATGTATAIQTADNTAVAETDLTDTSVTAPVRTIAGQQDVAIQLLDQSPVSFDQVIFSDLIGDYATKLDAQVIGGSGAAGQVLGIRNTAGIGTVAAATADTAGLYAAVASATSTINTSRFRPANTIVMHPRRWAALLADTDTTGRPLVVPAAQAPQNAVATFGATGSEGVVGTLLGMPVVIDSQIPTNLGAGTDEDVVLVMKADDLRLWESGIRTRVYPSVGSGTLTVRLQVYGYLAFTAGRYPQSVVEITGLTPPTF
jgi:HK97 family phage major capsid protein